jgi:phosphoribosyl 1,2-cyclic phosphodiesterase
MEFIPIASSSKGNAYLLKSEGVAPLLIECGIPIKQLREKLSFGLSGLAGCLTSHEHMDHAKAVKDLLKAGVDCYMSKGTAEALGVEKHHRTNKLAEYDTNLIGNWFVFSFPLVHDATEPCGFFILNGIERFLFVPDTEYVKDRFTRATMIAIECNHLSDTLSENIQGGNIPATVGRRIRHSHASLETVKKFLLANDLTQCRQIWLIHLSDQNADEQRMKIEIQEITGVPVYVAES